MYRNLKAEMARQGVKVYTIAKVIKKSCAAVSNNLNGRGDFSINEALKIQAELFPGFSLTYLFTND